MERRAAGSGGGAAAASEMKAYVAMFLSICDGKIVGNVSQVTIY